jgi:hypothetical protein
MGISRTCIRLRFNVTIETTFDSIAKDAGVRASNAETRAPVKARSMQKRACSALSPSITANTVNELERLRDLLSADAIGYISQAIVHMSDVAQRRQATRDNQPS